MGWYSEDDFNTKLLEFRLENEVIFTKA
jgi:hypothetical protein